MKKLLVMACVVAGVWLSGLALGGQAVAAEPETRTSLPSLSPTDIPAPQLGLFESSEEKLRKKANMARLELIAADLRALREASQPDVQLIQHALSLVRSLDTIYINERNLVSSLEEALSDMKFNALHRNGTEQGYRLAFQDAVVYTETLSRHYSKAGLKV